MAKHDSDLVWLNSSLEFLCAIIANKIYFLLHYVSHVSISIDPLTADLLYEHKTTIQILGLLYYLNVCEDILAVCWFRRGFHSWIFHSEPISRHLIRVKLTLFLGWFVCNICRLIHFLVKLNVIAVCWLYGMAKRKSRWLKSHFNTIVQP